MGSPPGHHGVTRVHSQYDTYDHDGSLILLYHLIMNELYDCNLDSITIYGITTFYKATHVVYKKVIIIIESTIRLITGSKYIHTFCASLICHTVEHIIMLQNAMLK